MFERYTEKARRVIFFARYEASQYGSRSIEAEHLLLGLFREDRALLSRFLGKSDLDTEIRSEIEKSIPRGKRFSVSAEVPLSGESKRILNLAAEEAERLAQRHVGTEHLLLGILREKRCLAAQILVAKGLKPDLIRAQLSKGSPAEVLYSIPQTSPAPVPSHPVDPAFLTLDAFLDALQSQNSELLASLFHDNAQFVDVHGKNWKRGEIEKQIETLFAPYAKTNVNYTVDETLQDTHDMLVVMVVWRNAALGGEPQAWVHRMSVILVPEGYDWSILLVQVTPVLST